MTFQFMYSLCILHSTHHKYYSHTKTLVKWKLKQQHMQHEWKKKKKKQNKKITWKYDKQKKKTQTSFPFNRLFFRSWRWWSRLRDALHTLWSVCSATSFVGISCVLSRRTGSAGSFRNRRKVLWMQHERERRRNGCR